MGGDILELSALCLVGGPDMDRAATSGHSELQAAQPNGTIEKGADLIGIIRSDVCRQTKFHF